MIASLLTGAGLSLVTNILESVFGVVKDWQRRKLMVLEHEQSIELAKMNSEIRLAEAESERETAALEMEGAAFSASYQHAVAATGTAPRFIASLISLVRPVLTFGLLYIAWELVKASDDPALKAGAVTAIIELAATATAWWFGDRSFKRARGT